MGGSEGQRPYRGTVQQSLTHTHTQTQTVYACLCACVVCLYVCLCVCDVCMLCVGDAHGCAMDVCVRCVCVMHVCGQKVVYFMEKWLSWSVGLELCAGV